MRLRLHMPPTHRSLPSRVKLLYLAPLLALAPQLMAPSIFTISNDPDVSDPVESNVNIATLANILTFSNVNVTADESVTVVDDADLSVMVSGCCPGLVTAGTLRLNATTVNMDSDIIMGSGDLVFNASTVNLTGRGLFDDGTTSGALGADRMLPGVVAPTQVNVLADTALIEQASFIVDVLGG